MSYPKTLEEFWNYIQTDSAPMKVRYFFRNQSAIRSSCIKNAVWTTLQEFLDFLGTKVKLTKHRSYAYEPCGTYSLVNEEMEFLFRIDPSTPGVHGPLHGMPSICLCNAAALSKESGRWVSIL